MKKLLIITLLGLILTSLLSCDNQELNVGLNNFQENNKETKAKIILRGFSFTIYEIEYQGQKYLCSSEGGIVKE